MSTFDLIILRLFTHRKGHPNGFLSVLNCFWNAKCGWKKTKEMWSILRRKIIVQMMQFHFCYSFLFSYLYTNSKQSNAQPQHTSCALFWALFCCHYSNCFSVCCCYNRFNYVAALNCVRQKLKSANQIHFYTLWRSKSIKVSFGARAFSLVLFT